MRPGLSMALVFSLRLTQAERDFLEQEALAANVALQKAAGNLRFKEITPSDVLRRALADYMTKRKGAE